MTPSSPRSTGGSQKTSIEELSYEAAYAELETIVAALEAEGHPLEESLVLYERGQVLAQYCSNLLDKAELKVRQLGAEVSAGEEGGG
jgi:exodeoxyribonuclease VII small subunit